MSPSRFRRSGRVPDSPPNTATAQGTVAVLSWQHVVLALGLTGMSFLFVGFLVAWGCIDILTGGWVTLTLVSCILSMTFGRPMFHQARKKLASLIAPEDRA